jgi:hypothetical protein
MTPKLLSVALLCALIYGCTKTAATDSENVNQPSTCNYIPKWNQGAVCKGRITTPSLGTIHYTGLKRFFLTSGQNSVNTDTRYINQTGDTIVHDSFWVRLTINPHNYYITVSEAPGGGIVIFDPVPPGTSRFDTCTGNLYLKYSWNNHTMEVCDTCVFR